MAHWVPTLVDGQKPFGAIDGVRQDCPTPVLSACGCAYRSWVVPGDVGKTCDLCREKVRAVA